MMLACPAGIQDCQRFTVLRGSATGEERHVLYGWRGQAATMSPALEGSGSPPDTCSIGLRAVISGFATLRLKETGAERRATQFRFSSMPCTRLKIAPEHG